MTQKPQFFTAEKIPTYTRLKVVKTPLFILYLDRFSWRDVLLKTSKESNNTFDEKTIKLIK